MREGFQAALPRQLMRFFANRVPMPRGQRNAKQVEAELGPGRSGTRRLQSDAAWLAPEPRPVVVLPARPEEQAAGISKRAQST